MPLLMSLEPVLKYLAIARNVLAAALLCLVCALLFACSMIEQNPVTSQLVVSMATAKTVEQASDPAERAARIVDIGNQTLALLQPDARTTLDLIAAIVAVKIDYTQLTPADRDAVNLLLTAIQAELEKRIGAGELQPDEILLVRDVVQWVVDSASRYLVHQPQG